MNDYGEYSSAGRASGCGSEGRGFKSHYSPHTSRKATYGMAKKLKFYVILSANLIENLLEIIV